MSRITIKILESSGKAYKIQNERGHIAWMPQSFVKSDNTVELSDFVKCNEEYEIFNGILLKDTGKDMPNYDPNHRVKIKSSDLDELTEGVTGIKHSQLAILGVYPLRTGWKNLIVGTLIASRRLELAKMSKGKYLSNKKIVPVIYDEARLIKVYEEELELVTKE